MDFFDNQHAHMYLNHSIIRLDDKPIMVQAVDNDGNGRPILLYCTLGHHRVHNISLRSPRLNLTPVKLGMYNYFFEGKYREAAMIYRNPQRAWKVGLSTSNISVLPVRVAGDNIFTRQRFTDLLHSKDMESCILGNYPTYNRVLKDLKGCQYRSAAFSRRFAMVAGGKLHYKCIKEPVGETNRNAPSLYDAFQYLAEQLEEDMR